MPSYDSKSGERVKLSATMCVCMCVCKQLPGNQSFDRQVSANKKSCGVRRVRQWIQTGNCLQVCYVTVIGVHEMHIRVQHVCVCVCAYMHALSSCLATKVLIREYLPMRRMVVSGG